MMTSSIIRIIFSLILSLSGGGCLFGRASVEPTEKSRTEVIDRRVVRKCDWKTGTVFGLTPGKSTSKDVDARFGKPIWQGPPDYEDPGDEELIDMEYHDVGGIESKWEALAPRPNIGVIVSKNTGIVKIITIYPSELNKSSFDAAVGGSQPCMCRREGTTDPEEPSRFPRMFNYDSLGLALNVRKDGSVIYFEFRTECE